MIFKASVARAPGKSILVNRPRSPEARLLERPVHIIAESHDNDLRIVLPASEGGIGLDAVWADDFHHAIIEDREPAASGLDGLRVVQVTLAMIASARDQRTIRIEPMTV